VDGPERSSLPATVWHGKETEDRFRIDTIEDKPLLMRVPQQRPPAHDSSQCSKAHQTAADWFVGLRLRPKDS
jgi:hypothetical protein